MSIGSAPEIGVTFTRWGLMTEQQQQAWFAHMKTWGADLLGGYGTLEEWRQHERANHF